MPIEYKTYGCKFKCYQRHKPDYRDIAAHEEICWKNPKNKTCLTCKYEHITAGYNGYGDEPSEPSERECAKSESHLTDWQEMLAEKALNDWKFNALTFIISNKLEHSLWKNKKETALDLAYNCIYLNCALWEQKQEGRC